MEQKSTKKAAPQSQSSQEEAVEKQEEASAPEPTTFEAPNMQSSSVWAENSFAALGTKPEIVHAALLGVSECTREEAKRAVEDFLSREVS
jgi:hypothetical protein